MNTVTDCIREPPARGDTNVRSRASDISIALFFKLRSRLLKTFYSMVFGARLRSLPTRQALGRLFIRHRLSILFSTMSESHAAPLVPDSSPPTPWSNNIDSGKSTIYGEISVPDPYVEGNLPEPEFATRQAYFTREYLDQSPNLTRLEDTVNCCNGYAKVR
jgi:hypothetical protein